MRDLIAKAAAENNRSMNAELVDRIEKSLDDDARWVVVARGEFSKGRGSLKKLPVPEEINRGRLVAKRGASTEMHPDQMQPLLDKWFGAIEDRLEKMQQSLERQEEAVRRLDDRDGAPRD
jgi:hypothetical protein